MKFHTAALQFLVASEALRFGVRAQSVVVDRTSNTNVADAAVLDVLLETPADSGGRFSATGINNHHAVVDDINDDDEISPFTSSDGDTVSTQRKLSKSSKKVKHPEALCTLSLFADSLFLYANQCFSDIMVTISLCDDEDDTCYISERLPSLPQEEQQEQENQEEEQCFVGGSFPAKENIQYNPSTGDCEFLYVDLVDDPCNLYTGDTGTGSLGLKARINVQNHPDVMFIQFTNDKGLTFYNNDNERVAKKRSSTQDIRYLRPEGAMKPVLSMMPHPFASHHRRLYSCASLDPSFIPLDYDAIFDGNTANPVGFYPKAKIRNDTPYRSNWCKVEYMACADDENDFIASGGTWTGPTRGGCLIDYIFATLILHDGSQLKCNYYEGLGTGYSQFYIMFIDGVCCLRSSHQDSDKCPELTDYSTGTNGVT